MVRMITNAIACIARHRSQQNKKAVPHLGGPERPTTFCTVRRLERIGIYWNALNWTFDPSRQSLSDMLRREPPKLLLPPSSSSPLEDLEALALALALALDCCSKGNIVSRGFPLRPHSRWLISLLGSFSPFRGKNSSALWYVFFLNFLGESCTVVYKA